MLGSRGLIDCVVAICILCAGFLLLRHLETAVDIDVSDETSYLRAGIRMGDDGLPSPGSGVLYSLWFAFLSRFRGDPVALYYLNCRVLTILLAVAFYAALRRHRVSRLTSLVGAGWMLFAAGNLQVWPKPAHLAALLLMTALAAGMPRRLTSARHAVLVIAALLAAFARPEFAVTYVLLWAVLAHATAAERSRGLTRRQAASVIGCPLVISLALFALLGMPGGGSDRYRVFLAFGQHFSLNWTGWHHSQLDPWRDWQSIVADAFGPVHSVKDALVADPVLFIRHGLSNGLHLPSNLCGLLTPRPYRGALSPGMALEGAAILVVFLLLSRLGGVRVRRRGPDGGWPSWPILLFALPGLLSSLLMHPREHYLFLPAMLVMGWCLSRADRALPPGLGDKAVSTLPAALLLVAFTAAYPVAGATLPNVATIEAMRSATSDDALYVLEAGGDHGIYGGRAVYPVGCPAEGAAADSLVARVHMVILSPELESDCRLEGDPDWDHFRSDPSRFGFVEISIAGTPRILYVRRELVAAAPEGG